MALYVPSFLWCFPEHLITTLGGKIQCCICFLRAAKQRSASASSLESLDWTVVRSPSDPLIKNAEEHRQDDLGCVKRVVCRGLSHEGDTAH